MIINKIEPTLREIKWVICKSLISMERYKADMSSYCPMSLLCCISKVFGQLLYDQLYEHCRHKINENQLVFQKQRSAVVQLLIFLDSVSKKFDDKNVKELSVLYLDIAKAFQTVAHHLLIVKLEKFLE